MPNNTPTRGFTPSGVDDEFALALLEELVRRGWVTVDSPLHGDDRLIAARGVRLASAGRCELIAWRQSDKLAQEGMPASPVEAWTKLRSEAEPFFPFARSVDEAQAEMIARGMFQSGPSIVKAMEVAYDHGLTSAPAEGTSSRGIGRSQSPLACRWRRGCGVG